MFYKNHLLDSEFWGGWDVTIQCAVSYSGRNVTCSLKEISPASYAMYSKYNWKMRLQRYGNGKWNIIGTRTGYVSTDSPSSRTFTNVRLEGRPMRVLVTYSDGSGRVKNYTSKSWTM